MKVRYLSEKDLPSIYKLSLLHKEEISNYKNLEINQCILYNNLWRSITDSSCPLTMLVLEKNNQVIGYMWLSFSPSIVSTDLYLSEMFTYVDKENRKSKALYLLIEEAKKLAKKMKCSELHIGVTSGICGLEELYDKRFSRLGSLYKIDIRGI